MRRHPLLPALASVAMLVIAACGSAGSSAAGTGPRSW
jgi:hypothetical protein